MTEYSAPTLVDAFLGERYAALDRLRTSIAPPYDVISPEERAELAARDPHNVVQLILPEGGADRYRRAARLLEQWRAGGILIRDSQPSVYVVQQDFTGPDGRPRVRTGVIGAVAAEPYEAGRVRPHERTHAGPKADRLALMQATGAALEALFLLARDERGHLQRRLEGVTRHAPLARGELGDVAIGLWRVGGVQAREIARAAGEAALYIADGHHRYETTLAYLAESPPETGAVGRLPALIVPIGDPGLVVLPTHRYLSGNIADPDALLAAWGGECTVREWEGEERLAGLLDAIERGAASCGVILPGPRLFALAWAESDDPPGPLIGVVERRVVGPLAEATNGSGEVSYSPDAAAVLEAVVQRRASAGVLVRATRVEEVLAVSDAGGVMPPKSTYFRPKVPSGLVLMDFTG